MIPQIFSTLSTSLGLGLGAGINAYATLLVFGLLARFEPALVHGELAGYFARTPVLIVLALLYTIEFVADKIPAVDHVWDVIHTFIRPVAGALVAYGAVNAQTPKGLVIVAAAIGGVAALGSHVTKAGVRAISTTTTGGLGNPILSLFEDLFVFLQSTVALVLPALFLVLLLVLVGPMTILLLRRRRRLQLSRAH